jgi:hypothetical protein
MKKRFRISDFGFRIWGPIAIGLVLAGTGTATTVVKMDLATLVKRAESIVQGRVEQVYVEWDATRSLAFTYASVRVDDPMKGERRRTVLIRQLGGKVGALNLFIAGMPKFTPGDDVILFLKDQQDGTFQVLGLNQGKYEIVNDLAVSNISGLELVDPKTGRMVQAGLVEQAPLAAFKSKIRELLR